MSAAKHTPGPRPYMLTEEAMRALLVDIEHCRDALEFRPDLVQRLKWFAQDHRSLGEMLTAHRQHMAERERQSATEFTALAKATGSAA